MANSNTNSIITTDQRIILGCQALTEGNISALPENSIQAENLFILKGIRPPKHYMLPSDATTTPSARMPNPS